MKNLANFLLGYLLLTNLGLIIALQYGFYPIEKIEARGRAANDFFGYSVSNAGDFNKDGFDDIIIGAYAKDSAKGAVYVIYGGEITNMLSEYDFNNLIVTPTTNAFIITGTFTNGQLGFSVSSAGDINQDGYDDIIIGAPGQSGSGFIGAAYVIYGRDKSIMTNIVLSSSILDPHSTGFMITGNSGYNSLGFSVSSAGDVNKDGYDDILIGAYGQGSSKGAVYVIYGGPKSSMTHIALETQTLDPPTTGFMISGHLADDEFGYSVHGAGDINKDGYDDIIIGAYGEDINQGAAYVIYGGNSSTMANLNLNNGALNPLTTGFKITGSAAGDFFGYSVSNAGDINKDGYDDIIIGAYGKNSGQGAAQGAAYVIYGGIKTSMPNIDLSSVPLNPLTTGFMITGNALNDFFGFSVSCAGDVNNDGYNDTIIGAHNKGLGRGAAYVIYGGPASSMANIDLSSTDLDPLTTGFSILGETNNAHIGVSVSAGYINNDHYSDLIIGAPVENSNRGAAYLAFSQCSAHCTACSSPSTCTACLPGYPLVNSLCIQCPTNCETCTDEISCDVCTSPYLLYGGQCIVSCPDHIFTTTGKCQGCPQGCSSCTSLSACQTCLPGFSLTKSNLCEVKIETPKIEEKDGEKAAAGVFEGTALVGASLASGSSLPLNFGLVAKLVRNFKYMRLPVSQELYGTFVSWKVASGFMSAPDSWSEKYSSKTIPVVFSRYKLQSAFLINFWKPFIMTIIGIAVFGVFKLVEVLVNNNKKSMMYKISRQVNVTASNFALTQFYSNLDDVIFYFIIEMRSTEFETGFRVLSSLLAIVLLLVGVIFIGLHFKLIGKYQKLKEIGSPKQFEVKFENINLIYKDFKDTNSLAQSFLMINVLRSIIASLIFATLFEYPMVQISFLFVLNILMIVFIWNKKSFKEFTNTCGQLFCEGILFIANICVFLLALFDHADSYPVSSIKGLGKCIIILNYILLFGCAILLLVNLVKILYQSYLDRKKPQQAAEKIFTSTKFTRPDSVLDANLSTNNDFITESQDNSRFDGAVTLQTIGGNHEKLERDPKMDYQQGNLHNSSIRNRPRKQNHTEGFKKSNSSNVVLQSSNPAGNIREETSQASFSSHNVLPRSRLMRNREITKARIAQFSENSGYGSPESRIQDPSFHSGMTLNQGYAGENQDLSLMSSEMGTDSPPFRGLELMPRRRAGTMKK